MPVEHLSPACFVDKDGSWRIHGTQDPTLSPTTAPEGIHVKDELVTSFDQAFAKSRGSLSLHPTASAEYQPTFHDTNEFSHFFTASSENVPKRDVPNCFSVVESCGRRGPASESENLVALLETGIYAGRGGGGACGPTFLEKVSLQQLPQGTKFEHFSSALTNPEPSWSSLFDSAAPCQALSHLPELSHSDALALSMALGATPDSTVSTGHYLEAAIKWHLSAQECLPDHITTPEHHGGTTALLSPNDNSSTLPSDRAGLDSVECTTPQQVSRLLNILGSTSRSKADPFIDVAILEDPGVPRMARGGVCELFPDKLYRMIRDMDVEGKTDVIGFLPHGRAFKVHKMDEFLKVVLPRYFSDQSKWSSFSRQLNLYGFLRVTSGRDAGAYYHELFLQGRPNLVAYMRRVGAPKGMQDRRRFKVPEGDDPDFWALPPIVPDDAE